MKNQHRARAYAKKLRTRATPAEKVLKAELERQKIRFKFQRSVPKGTYQKGFFIPDFCIKRKFNGRISMLYIELDGGYHNTSEQKEKDAYRTKQLEKGGMNKVIRFTNDAILEHLPGVINIIKDLCIGSEY